MLKRFYLQISSLMILGTVVLLVCFGGFVYLELNHQLRMEGDMSLRSEFVEVHDTCSHSSSYLRGYFSSAGHIRR